MFENRYHAGEVLSKVLKEYLEEKYLNLDDVIVAVLPRGGLPVAFEFLKSTGVGFFILPVKKIPAPYNEEVAIGAIAPDGFYLIDEAFVRYLGISRSIIDLLKNKALEEVKARLKKYWVDLNQIKQQVEGKVAILVDDGVATGYTAAVAGLFLKNLGAKEVILAVPVCPSQLPSVLEKSVDKVICLTSFSNFQAVGQGYVDFSQVGDDEFFDILKRLKNK